jgi:hypothetical protein
MKILCITSSEEDYLSDSLLIGLKVLFKSDCIDYPRREILYSDCPTSVLSQVRGHGFTLYSGVLQDDSESVHFPIRTQLERSEFDLIVFSDIWRQFGLFTQWRPYLNSRNTIICDGHDSPQVYPCAGLWWRKPYFWFLPRATVGFVYFKREWTSASKFNLWHRMVPFSLWHRLPDYRGLRKIAFSIPESKLVSAIPPKNKLFGSHIVDPEVSAKVNGSKLGYAFTTEADYYHDLQQSRYGITTKRAGWDCLRHYEIAANGCVPCFRNLHLKPDTCAPHGLVDGVNCLNYTSYEDLMRRLGEIDETRYQLLAQGALAWARENTCQRAAERVLQEWQTFTGQGQAS